ncbi:metal ABC transporter ATP-binding protein [Streptomyces sp. SPB074]|uniref:metal ABC transporter ATP-binding protein n=1 Tax=Streptomyces sp. (strain SPB074) TaxID=465543 RepID=UPI0001D1E0D4|nr:ATP-binding cassette domain-containing protein [Streptomyces sp. SPB074]EDY45113.2 cyclopropane-fatty-acyl-phospholipid synthase domain-containing protein [Streptomyces sp. SPB074]
MTSKPGAAAAAGTAGDERIAGAAHGRPGGAAALLDLRGGAVAHGGRTVWRDLDLRVAPSEYLAVLGTNGAGKTSLLRALLGRQPLSAGTLTVLGEPARRANRHIGYIPQQASLSSQTPVRARDLVGFGVSGHRFGPRRPRRAERARVDELLASVGAAAYADAPLGELSGGERQRVRVAQALATDPRLLLCDEPLVSLDPHHQRAVTELIDARRRSHDTGVVFVTHEINPVLDLVDRVLYLAPGAHRTGTPGDVLTSASLSRLYGTHVDVVRVGGRVVVAGAYEEPAHHPGEPAPHHGVAR